MDRSKVLKLAQEAKISIRGHYDETGSTPQELDRFAALIEREVRGDVEPVAEHDLKDKRCECCGYMTYHREHMGCIKAAYTHPTPAVVRQLVDGLAGLIDFIEIDNLKIGHVRLGIAKAALAAAKEAGL